MTDKKNKSGDHPTRKSKAKSPVSMRRCGRPVRNDNPQRITLHLALDIKRRAYELACGRRVSIGRLVEDLIADCKE